MRPTPSRNNSTDPTAPVVRPSPSRNSSYSKIFVDTPRSMASGFWSFCKYGPEIPDSDERLNSVVPTDPEKRRLPWQKWQ